ncbi:Gamma-aminobutyric acid (GABA) B receptor [Seminavis robusta]|uniref:Gamma-aminobutyric acid (GABA) B receptor n=1 Tax=Seminavis robusta TaxID=568900 RepID=A0A9N8HM37_9STRA|nr:Gamma-aminobutyric acid (GABA) B receptor [Seminavis robusta]|eukprot:Sro719_g192310.1 Gamma-aminobutyric acid (GABA) B receptor (1414) ;mRNA; f:14818-19139
MLRKRRRNDEMNIRNCCCVSSSGMEEPASTLLTRHIMGEPESTPLSPPQLAPQKRHRISSKAFFWPRQSLLLVLLVLAGSFPSGSRAQNPDNPLGLSIYEAPHEEEDPQPPLPPPESRNFTVTGVDPNKTETTEATTAPPNATTSTTNSTTVDADETETTQADIPTTTTSTTSTTATTIDANRTETTQTDIPTSAPTTTTTIVANITETTQADISTTTTTATINSTTTSTTIDADETETTQADTPTTTATSSSSTTTTTSTATTNTLVFAVMPKTTDNPYFELVETGCKSQADRMTRQLVNTTVICEYVGPTSQDSKNNKTAEVQIEFVLDLLQNDTIAGIAISVENETSLLPVLELQRNTTDYYNNKPIVTFDSDLTKATHLRWAYVGTNNTFFGKELARAMLQLHPTVGTFAVLHSGFSPNMIERLDGFINELEARQPGWEQVAGSPGDAQGNLDIALAVLDGLARQDPDCIVSLMGLPMRIVTNETDGTQSIPWQAFYDEHYERGITFLSGDSMSHQLDLLASGYVQALIGQLPWEMGAMSIEILYNISQTGSIEGTATQQQSSGIIVTSSQQQQGQVVTSNNGHGMVTVEEEDPTFFGTNVLSHILIPLEIPEADVPGNLIGNLSYVGYSCFGIILFTAYLLLHWTINYRNVRVVQVAQPKFLAMVVVGVALMGACLVPLSMDDGGDPDNLSSGEKVWICMSVPWLASVGFTMTFSALYAKTRRINKIFHSNSAFARVKVSEQEVLLPFTVLLLINLALLSAWTYMDPLTYTRNLELGSDGWTRVVSTYGTCQSDYVERYLIPIACLNFGCLIMANWQAFEARHIEAEFSETKYIGVCMASMLQAAISGVPVLFVVKDNPQAFYLVLVFMIFVIGMVIMLVIFVPKILFARLFLSKTEGEQRDFISFIIQQSGRARHNRFAKAQASQVGQFPNYQASIMESRWSEAPNFASEAHNSVYNGGVSQVGVSSDNVSSLSGGRSSEFAATAPTMGAMRMSNIAEGSEHPTAYEPGESSHHSDTESFFVSGHSGDTPLTGVSMRSLMTRSTHQSKVGTSRRNLTRRPSNQYHGLSMRSLGLGRRPSSHHPMGLGGESHHSPMGLDLDDGEDGMLVYRTMTVAPDGSVHTRHSHMVYDFLDDDAASFYSYGGDASTRSFGVGVGRSAGSLPGLSGRSIGLSGHTVSTGISARTLGGGTLGGDSSHGSQHNRTAHTPANGTSPAADCNRKTKQGAPTRLLNAIKRSPRRLNSSDHTQVSGLHSGQPQPRRKTPRRVASDGGRNRQGKLPSMIMKAIKERRNEDSESSERSLESLQLTRKSVSSHARLSRVSAEMQELNAIPEVGGVASDSGSESFKSACMFDETDHEGVEPFFSSEAQSNGGYDDDRTMDDSQNSFAIDGSDNDVERAPTLRKGSR